MRTFFSVSVAAAAAAMTLAACSGAGQQAALPQNALGAMPTAPSVPTLNDRPPIQAAYKGLAALYVYDLATNKVDVLKNKTYREIGTIPESSSFAPTLAGSFIDKRGNYYLADATEVLEYAPRSQAPLYTYTVPSGDTINGLSVDAHGDVFVTTDNSTTSTSSVIQYFQRSNTPVYSCAMPGGASDSYSGVTIDSNNDVFVEYIEYSGSSWTSTIWEYAGGLDSQGSPGGCTASEILSPVSGYGHSLVLDNSGNLVAPLAEGLGSGGGVIAVISPSGSSYSISREITADLSSPLAVSLTKSNKYLFATNYNASSTDLIVFDYATGAVVKILGTGNGLNEPLLVSDGPDSVY